MHQILKHLHEDDKRLILITGQLGVGKSRFVKELARYMVMHSHYKDGVYYVDFQHASNDKDVSNILREAGLEKYLFFCGEHDFDDSMSSNSRGSRNKRASKAREENLKNKKMLLVLDNVDKVYQSMSSFRRNVSHLIRKYKGAQIIMT
jgi:Cdc6-like AAA superfamily ATPase